MKSYRIGICLVLLWIDFFQSFMSVIVEAQSLDLNDDKFFCKVSLNEDCKKRMFLNTMWTYEYLQNFSEDGMKETLEDYPTLKTNNIITNNQTFHNNISFSVINHGGDPCTIFIYLWDKSTNKTIMISQQENSSVWELPDGGDPYESELNLTTWNTFILTLREENFTLTEKSNNFSISFPQKGFEPTHFSFGSSNKANWILHSYGVFASNENGSASIKVPKSGNNQTICIAIFVRACPDSSLILELLGENNEILDNQTSKEINKWEKLQLRGNIINEAKLKITLKSGSCPSYIGDIKKCTNDMSIMDTNVEVKSNPNTKMNDKRTNSNAGCFSTGLNEEFPNCDLQQNGIKLMINLKRTKTFSCPFYYHLVINCSNEWCNQLSVQTPTITVEENDIMEVADIEFGLSDYTVYLGMSINKNKINVEYKEICSITTGPIAPRPIREIRVYEETSTSISIRWPESYPKNGVLELYIIEYQRKDTEDFGSINRADWIEYRISNPKVCEIWELNFCVTLQNLSMGEGYSIKIKAKNKDVNEFSKPGISVDAFTSEKTPSPPIDLTTNWDDLNLRINCSYPLDAKGPIRNFHILINNTETTINTPSNTRNYSFDINASNYSSTRQEISIQFSNLEGKSEFLNTTIIVPPKTPIFHDKLIKGTDENVLIDVSLIENLDNESLIYVFYLDKKSNITLNKDCDDFHILENNSTKNLTIPFNETTRSFEKNNESSPFFFVVFVKNSFEDYSRCATYSDNPIFSKKETPNTMMNNTSETSDNVIVIIVVLLLVTITLSVTIYMYKTDRIAYKPQWVNTFLPQTRTIIPNVSYKNDEVLIPVCSNSKYSQVVKVKDFKHYVNNAIEQGVLLQEYMAMDALNDKFATEIGLEPNNSKKNRYKNIIAYDETRVKLSNSLYSNTSDYINANYIDGFNKEKAFIAAQAPTEFTILDFWAMIWQENVECVVMLSKLIECGKAKCEKYWPDELENDKFGEIAIKCINSTEINHDVTIRTFEISSGTEMRKLVQIHYEGWLDKDVPISTGGIENVLDIMKNFGNEHPVLVHCSAGVGRTGTLILANIAVNMAKATGIIDMPSILYALRQQRTKMVQTFDQYIFAHQVVSNLTEPIYAN